MRKLFTRTRAGWLVLFALVTLNYWLNPVGIAEDQCFSTVQRYSESLVVGAIIAKERGVVLPKKANLAPATVGGTGIDPISRRLCGARWQNR